MTFPNQFLGKRFSVSSWREYKTSAANLKIVTNGSGQRSAPAGVLSQALTNRVLLHVTAYGENNFSNFAFRKQGIAKLFIFGDTKKKFRLV